MSRMAVSEMASTIKQMKLTKSPDKMVVLMKPTQSMAGPNFGDFVSPLSFGWSCTERKKETKITMRKRVNHHPPNDKTRSRYYATEIGNDTFFNI